MFVDDKRQCSHCLERKPLDGFSFRGGKRGGWLCEPCQREYDREGARRRREADPEQTRRYALKRLYGITPERYDEMRAAQDYRCAICGVSESEIDVGKVGGRPRADGTRAVVFPLHVDHCHTSGQVRSLLCPDCNRMIGCAKEDAGILRAASLYVERWAALKESPRPASFT